MRASYLTAIIKFVINNWRLAFVTPKLIRCEFAIDIDSMPATSAN